MSMIVDEDEDGKKRTWIREVVAFYIQNGSLKGGSSNIIQYSTRGRNNHDCYPLVFAFNTGASCCGRV